MRKRELCATAGDERSPEKTYKSERCTAPPSQAARLTRGPEHHSRSPPSYASAIHATLTHHTHTYTHIHTNTRIRTHAASPPLLEPANASAIHSALGRVPKRTDPYMTLSITSKIAPATPIAMPAPSTLRLSAAGMQPRPKTATGTVRLCPRDHSPPTASSPAPPSTPSGDARRAARLE